MAMDRDTGKEVYGLAEIEQSIDTILSTMLGDRVMRGSYGSDLLSLTDIGVDASGKARLTQSIGQALRTYEPRVRVARVVYEGDAGEVVATVQGVVPRSGERVSVQRQLA
jgi:phage baseplate assembly protein W